MILDCEFAGGTELTCLIENFLELTFIFKAFPKALLSIDPS